MHVQIVFRISQAYPVDCLVNLQAIHDPIETDDTWINGRSCESISAETSGGASDDTDWDNRKIACGMVAQVTKPARGFCCADFYMVLNSSTCKVSIHPSAGLVTRSVTHAFTQFQHQLFNCSVHGA